MQVLREWYGNYNSSLYLQEHEYAGEKFISFMYGFSMIGGNRYEGSENYTVRDAEDDNSKLVKLIRSDFSEEVLNDIRKCISDYKSGIEIKRWGHE